MLASTFEHYLHYYFDWLNHLNPLNKFILGLIVKTIHLLLSFLAAFGPFITNNVKYLTLLIVYYITLVTGWYVFGYCCCSTIEEKLDSSTKNNNKKSFISDMFENTIGKTNSNIIQAFIIFTPFFNTLFCLYKINYYCKRK
jgi:hypothetical protein